MFFLSEWEGLIFVAENYRSTGHGCPFGHVMVVKIKSHKKPLEMRRILVILSFFLVGVCSVAGQNMEVRLISGIGISPSNIDSKSDWIEFENHSNLIPIGLDANYIFFPEKRLNFFVGTGLEYTSNRYFQNVKELEYGYNLQSISFSQQHLGIPLRMGAEWKIFNANSIGFQGEFQYNFAMKKEVVTQSIDIESDLNGNLSYSYSLTNRTKNFTSREFSLYLKTQLANNLFLITSIDVEFRSSSGDYDFRTDQILIRTDIGTGEQYQAEASYVIQKKEIRNNMLGLKLGLTKYF
ncbi:MAG: hypothetical protein IPJ00_22540 [Saprospirales bacterium]|nr:hypothetical protein [Saprospirales bacterium]